MGKFLFFETRHWAAVFFVLFFLVGCQTPIKVSSKAEGGDQATAMVGSQKTISIVPFTDMSEIFGKQALVRSPISGKYFTTGKVEKGACSELTEQLTELLIARGDIRVIPSSMAEGVQSDITRKDLGSADLKKLAINTGRMLESEIVAVGFIYRYRDRVGKEYSVEEPASVAYDLHILDTASGHILWSGHVDETQKPLSDNILNLGHFLKRKGRWVTAQEMAFSALTDQVGSLVLAK